MIDNQTVEDLCKIMKRMTDRIIKWEDHEDFEKLQALRREAEDLEYAISHYTEPRSVRLREPGE